jgi:hypothetical protein
LPYTEVGRYPFLFIGYKGLGKGNGITRMNNLANPAVPVEISAYIANGALTVKDGKDGIDGTSPYFADLDNEIDSIACNNNGNPSLEQVVSTNVSLYYGSSKLTPTITVHDNNPTGPSYTNGTEKNGIVVSWNTNTGNV